MPQVHGSNYIYPDPNYARSYTSADYYVSKGMNTFRLPFRWERLQRTLYGPFDPAELQRLRTTVADLTAKGAWVVIDPHNYARYGMIPSGSGYRAGVIGTSDVPASAFRDFWSKLAMEFRNQPQVIFGLMNEPHDMSTYVWRDAANAAIAGIRSAGATQLILVSGNCWDTAQDWTKPWCLNATAMPGIADPGHNFAFEVHQYLRGGTDTCASETIGSERLAAFTSWARSQGAHAFLGEFAGWDDATCVAALDDMLTFIDRNSDVFIGWTYWAGGPWWAGRSLEPINGQDRLTMTALARHLGMAAPQWQISGSASPSPVTIGQITHVNVAVVNGGAAMTGRIQIMRRGGGLPDLVLATCPSGSGTFSIPGSGATTSCAVDWTASEANAPAEPFRIAAGVFDASWNLQPGGWADNLVTLSVTPLDGAQYGFESTVQGWYARGTPVTGVAWSSARAFTGGGSLRVATNAAVAGQGLAQVSSQPLPLASAVVTFHVYVPTTQGLISLQPFVQQNGPGWIWTGAWRSGASLNLGWNTLSLQVPANASPLYRLGVEFTLDGTGGAQEFFVDTISW